MSPIVDLVPVREAAIGRWPDILVSLGIPAKTLSGKHAPCPICGNSKPKFRFDDKDGRGTWICTCGSGDGMALAMKLTGLEFHLAAKRVEDLIGTARQVALKPGRSENSKRDAMNALWRSSHPVRSDDPVGRWLSHRVGLQSAPACLRCAPLTRYRDEEGRITHHPCMIAMVTDAMGRPATLHRTYLTKDGYKAPVDSPRLLMPGDLPAGSAVRLFPVEECLGIAEGIETAFAAANLFGMPVWSAINASNMAKWSPPTEVRKVVIFGDNDPKFAGQAHAWQLAHRLALKNIQTEVQIPTGTGCDWNDVLMDASHAA